MLEGRGVGVTVPVGGGEGVSVVVAVMVGVSVGDGVGEGAGIVGETPAAVGGGLEGVLTLSETGVMADDSGDVPTSILSTR